MKACFIFLLLVSISSCATSSKNARLRESTQKKQQIKKTDEDYAKIENGKLIYVNNKDQGFDFRETMKWSKKGVLPPDMTLKKDQVTDLEKSYYAKITLNKVRFLGAQKLPYKSGVISKRDGLDEITLSENVQYGNLSIPSGTVLELRGNLIFRITSLVEPINFKNCKFGLFDMNNSSQNRPPITLYWADINSPIPTAARVFEDCVVGKYRFKKGTEVLFNSVGKIITAEDPNIRSTLMYPKESTEDGTSTTLSNYEDEDEDEDEVKNEDAKQMYVVKNAYALDSFEEHFRGSVFNVYFSNGDIVDVYSLRLIDPQVGVIQFEKTDMGYIARVEDLGGENDKNEAIYTLDGEGVKRVYNATWSEYDSPQNILTDGPSFKKRFHRTNIELSSDGFSFSSSKDQGEPIDSETYKEVTCSPDEFPVYEKQYLLKDGVLKKIAVSCMGEKENPYPDL